MSNFEPKMHQIQFLRPTPCWGSLQCSPDPVAGFKGHSSKGRRGKGGNEGGEVSPLHFCVDLRACYFRWPTDPVVACQWDMYIQCVYARWPAMVERDPDWNTYQDTSEHSNDFVRIHVTFLIVPFHRLCK